MYRMPEKIVNIIRNAYESLEIIAGVRHVLSPLFLLILIDFILSQ